MAGDGEGKVWAVAAQAVGKPPQGALWVHVGDRGSDDFRFMHACVQAGKHFLIRAWEVHAPPEVEEPIKWILVTSVLTETVDQAKERVQWYTCRWLTEDYHQCLKTGCAIEKRQLDHGDDIQRLLGFLGPIAVRLLQMRNIARVQPQIPAASHIDPMMIDVLSQRLQWTVIEPLTMGDFWRGVAQLGGYQGRRGDGPPGWKIIWRGWLYLNDLTTGARLHAAALASRQSRTGPGLEPGATWLG